MLVDEEGNRAEIDVRCLVRNPLIWQRFYQEASRACRHGSLELAGPGSRLWANVIREVAEAGRRPRHQWWLVTSPPAMVTVPAGGAVVPPEGVVTSGQPLVHDRVPGPAGNRPGPGRGVRPRRARGIGADLGPTAPG